MGQGDGSAENALDLTEPTQHRGDLRRVVLVASMELELVMTNRSFIVGGPRRAVTGWARHPGPPEVAGVTASSAGPSVCRPGGGRGSQKLKDYLRVPPSVKGRDCRW
jgi:hypothetical protein